MPSRARVDRQAIEDVYPMMYVNRHGGRGLDVELCRVCGWLHDLAKGHPRHEAEGARWLDALGFERAAAIVEEADGASNKLIYVIAHKSRDAAKEKLARIRAEGKGETQPTASNATAQGRANNRRVELEILSNECGK